MSYKDAYHPNVKSDLKRLDKSVTRQIHHVYIEAILLNPFAHEKLHGDLEGVVSYPKCCIKYDADILKNLCKATRFDYDTHDTPPLIPPY
jgi:hypothetical protein